MNLRPLGLSTAMGVPYAMGANLAFHRHVFDAVGGFDPAFDIGCDDVDFCLRAHDEGFSIGFTSDAVVHYRNKHRLGAVARQRFSYGRGDERLARRHGQLGDSTYRVSQRLKIVAVRVARNLRRTGDFFDTRARAGYVAGWAFVAGLVWELVTDALPRDEAGRAAPGDARSAARNSSSR